jgi:hypothetical protein
MKVKRKKNTNSTQSSSLKDELDKLQKQKNVFVVDF